MDPSTTRAPTPISGKVLVTGASGHLGANLTRRLLADGHDVRVLIYGAAEERALEGLKVERITGDVRSLEDMRMATRGIRHVFHAAAKVSTLNASAGEEKDLYDINVIGTRNVMRAALENGVARAVLTGSFSAVGFDPLDPSQPSDEEMPFYPFDVALPYSRAKAQAEHEMLKVVADGLDAVIATSCSIIGPHDYLPSRMGRTLCDYSEGKLRAYVPGGFMFVAARDIVAGHVLAMERGRAGQKYIFASEFLTMDDLLERFASATGLRRRPVRVPAQVLSSLTAVYSGVLSRYFPNAPQRLTPGAIRILQMHRKADTSKARSELGFVPSTIAEAVREAYEFFVRTGRIRGRKSASGADEPRAPLS